MDSDKHRPICTRPWASDRRIWPLPEALATRPCDPFAAGDDADRMAMKDDQVANMARILPQRDPKLWRTRKLIAARPPSVDHRPTPEVQVDTISVVSVWRHVYGHVVSASTLVRLPASLISTPMSRRMSNVAPSSGINDVIPPAGARPPSSKCKAVSILSDDSPPWPAAPAQRWPFAGRPRPGPVRSVPYGCRARPKTSRRRLAAEVATGWLNTARLGPLYAVVWAFVLFQSRARLTSWSREAEKTSDEVLSRVERRSIKLVDRYRIVVDGVCSQSGPTSPITSRPLSSVSYTHLTLPTIYSV